MPFSGGVPFSVPGAPEETLLMFANRFWHTSGHCVANAHGTHSCVSGGPGTHTDALMVSRNDGADWAWVGDRETLLGTGMVGSWRSKMVWSMRDPVVLGDCMLIYFWGSNAAEMEHIKGQPIPPPPPHMSGLGVAEGRVDGFGSLEAGYATPGAATTVPSAATAAWSAGAASAGTNEANSSLFDGFALDMQNTLSESLPLKKHFESCSDAVRKMIEFKDVDGFINVQYIFILTYKN